MDEKTKEKIMEYFDETIKSFRYRINSNDPDTQADDTLSNCFSDLIDLKTSIYELLRII